MTSNDVVLTAALRNNLLSLQNTQGLIDTTQFRLATGRKINSALDGPQSFFAAQALSNRANDLSRLLDSIGQSIQVIKAADNGITAMTRLVEQADSVAQAARDALAQGQVEAKVVGNRDLRGIDDLTAMPGITDQDTLVLSVTDENGDPLTLGPAGGATAATAVITIDTNDSIEDLVTEINDLRLDDGGGNANGEKIFDVSLDASGHLVIKTINGGDFNMNFVNTTSGAAPDDDAANLSLASELGFGLVAQLVPDGGAGGTNNVEFTAVSDVVLDSFALHSVVTGEIAQASETLDNIVDEFGNPLFAGLDDNANDVYQISINGGAVQSIPLADAGNNPISIQAFVDAINANGTLNEHIKASYDDTTGQITIDPIGGAVQSIEISFTGDNAGDEANFGFGRSDFTVANAGETTREAIRLAAAAADLAQFESDFNRLRDQMDLLIEDTGYRGTNLLNGDDLLTVFNEFRTSTLTTNGVTMSADGLGLDEADFSRVSSVEASLAQVRAALETVRGFGSTLANDLAIIQARETFTKELVNTLTEGADKLTVADQNEEGAKLLALQTRQQLGVTSLSLASQSQQSILRLF